MVDIVERLNTCLRVYNDSAQEMLKEDLRLAIEEIERLRCQVTDLTRLAGCAAITKDFSSVKLEVKTLQDIEREAKNA